MKDKDILDKSPSLRVISSKILDFNGQNDFDPSFDLYNDRVDPVSTIFIDCR